MDVAALDLFVDRDLTEIADCETIRDFPNSILDQARRWPDHAVLLCGGMENFPDIVAELESRHTVIGPSARQIRELRSLENWGEWVVGFAEGDWIRFPITREPEPSASGVPHEQLVSQRSPPSYDPSIDWLYKGYRSAGGMQVVPLGAEDQNRMSGGYIQQHVSGPVLGVTFGCTPRQTIVLGVMQNVTMGKAQLAKLPSSKATPYLYTGSSGPVQLDLDIESRLAIWAGNIASSIRYQGILQADFILGNDGALYLLEFNPRWTASMELIEMSARSNLVDLQLGMQFSEGGTLSMLGESDKLQSRQVQKRILYASQDLSVSSETSNAMMERSNWWKDSQVNDQVLVGWADIPQPGTLITAGSPFATIWAIRPIVLETIDATQVVAKNVPDDRWPEIDALLKTLVGYPACIHTVFTGH
jgi:hypothetical protein